MLGTPLGTDAYVRAFLTEKREEHDTLLERIPSVPDLQAAWLILLFCANARSNYLLRALPPSQVREFAASHDDAMATCLQRLLANERQVDMHELHLRRARLPLRHGGLGLRSAVRTRAAANWASWADTLPLLAERHPGLVAHVAPMLQGEAPATANSVQEVLTSSLVLSAEGFDAPSWASIAAVARPAQNTEVEQIDGFGDPVRGWQRDASVARDAVERDDLLTDLDSPSRALMLSQAGPMAARALTAIPTAPEITIP